MWIFLWDQQLKTSSSTHIFCKHYFRCSKNSGWKLLGQATLAYVSEHPESCWCAAESQKSWCCSAWWRCLARFGGAVCHTPALSLLNQPSCPPPLQDISVCLPMESVTGHEWHRTAAEQHMHCINSSTVTSTPTILLTCHFLPNITHIRLRSQH